MSPITGGPAGEWPTRSRVLDPDTPTADAPADTDERLRNEVFEAVYNIVCDHPMWEGVEYQSSREAKIGDFCDETADALLPLVRAQVEAARRDAEERALQVVREAVHQADVRQESGLHTRGRIREAVDNYATRNVYAEIRDRAARGETRQP